MAKTKKMALGGMGAQPSNALQPYKPPSSGSVLRGGMGAQPPNALQPYKPPVGGPATKPGMQGLGQAMGARPQGSALGQAAATKLGQITGRPNMPSPSVVKSPFVPPQTQRPAVQAQQQQRDQQRLDQQAQQQRAAGMASMGVKPLTPPPSGPVAPRGFGPPPGPTPTISPFNRKPSASEQQLLQQAQAYQALQSQPKPVGQTTASPSEQQALQQAHAQLKAQAQAQQTALPPTAGLKGTRVSADQTPSPMKKGGMVSSKPKVSSASSRGDGIATKGKTKGRFV